jgi:exonuclease VII large subunit
LPLDGVSSPTASAEIAVPNMVDLLNSIDNLYWRSIAALTATYNFRKEGRTQEELDILKKYITNEFGRIDVIKNWKPLNKK